MEGIGRKTNSAREMSGNKGWQKCWGCGKAQKITSQKFNKEFKCSWVDKFFNGNKLYR